MNPLDWMSSRPLILTDQTEADRLLLARHLDFRGALSTSGLSLPSARTPARPFLILVCFFFCDLLCDMVVLACLHTT